MYILIFVLLLVFSLLEIICHFKNRILIFNIIFLVLAFMLCFRYGQGQDYLGYQYHYNFLDSDFSYFTNELSHGEIGWYVLTLFFVKVGATFEEFICILSFVMMFYTYKGIVKYSPYKIFSLLLLVPTYFFTYYFSGVRQGLILSLFLGFGIDFIQNKKYFKYIFLVLILTTIHKSAIILLLIPIVQKLTIKSPFLIAFLALIVSVSVARLGVFTGVSYLIGAEHYLDISISISAYLVRLILFGMIYFLHREVQDIENSELEHRLYNIYTAGFIIYSLLFFSAIISQRLTVPFKCLEVILIPIQMYILKRGKCFSRISFSKYIPTINIGKRKIISYVLIFVFILILEFVKNINSYIVQGEYKEMVNVFNYPYISIWDKESLSHWKNKVSYCEE